MALDLSDLVDKSEIIGDWVVVEFDIEQSMGCTCADWFFTYVYSSNFTFEKILSEDSRLLGVTTNAAWWRDFKEIVIGAVRKNESPEDKAFNDLVEKNFTIKNFGHNYELRDGQSVPSATGFNVFIDAKYGILEGLNIKITWKPVEKRRSVSLATQAFNKISSDVVLNYRVYAANIDNFPVVTGSWKDAKKLVKDYEEQLNAETRKYKLDLDARIVEFTVSVHPRSKEPTQYVLLPEFADSWGLDEHMN